jgi:hypothetical protein
MGDEEVATPQLEPEAPRHHTAYAVRREPSGALYVVDTATGAVVFGTFSENQAQDRCEQFNSQRGDAQN